MAEATAIEWTDSTFNPWWGCTMISPACDHCYAEALDRRFGGGHWGNVPRRRTSPTTWAWPRQWQRKASDFQSRHGRRRRVFCASMADVFDNQVPTAWRDDLWSLILDTPDLDWQLLTKRPMNIADMLPAFWGEVKGHVWLGTTVEDQRRADLNIPHLLAHDAAVRFVSCEPMLGPVDLSTCALSFFKHDVLGSDVLTTRRPHAVGATVAGAIDALRGLVKARVEFDEPFAMTGDRIWSIDWVIVGGESGREARPSHPDWFRSLRDQCARANVPFLFKQWGEWASVSEVEGHGPHHHFDDGATVRCIGKKLAGRRLDGVEHDGFPSP